jgi:hypothetical protein
MKTQTNYQNPAYTGTLKHNGYPYPNYSCKPVLSPCSPVYKENALVTYALGTMNKEQSKEVSGIDMILSGKKELIRSKIEMLLIQLSQRKNINYNISTGIDDDSCKLQGIIFQMGMEAYLVGKSRVQIEKMKFDLEREKRMEQASYFRDTALLNKDLKDALIEYIKETQNEKLFGD